MAKFKLAVQYWTNSHGLALLTKIYQVLGTLNTKRARVNFHNFYKNTALQITSKLVQQFFVDPRSPDASFHNNTVKHRK